MLRCALLTVSCALALAPAAGAQKLALVAVLDGNQTVPSSGSTAAGCASVVLDALANTLTYDLTHTGLQGTETSAELWGYAPAGSTGALIAPLPLGYKKVGTIAYPPSDEDEILAGLAYIRITSSAFPAGEIRGQLLFDLSPISMSASLDGLQTVPPTPSAAKGTAHVGVDPVANRLTFVLTFEGTGAAQTAVHIHGPAPAGQIALVKFPLPNNAGSHLIGVWQFDEADEADILSGLMYFNVHTSTYQVGEIRGQILPLAAQPAVYCTAKTTSLGCVPSISSSGVASASAPSGFVVSTSNVPGGNPGIFFYGTAGPTTAPFQGGTLCVAPPVIRIPAGAAGGTAGQCDGVYSVDLNAYVASGADPTLVAGTFVNLQTWFRDPPASFGTGVSDALMVVLRP